MDEREFQSKLADLIAQIGEMPTAKKEELEKLATETRERHDTMKKTVADLQESLDYLRLSIKYLLFDLEATRRENETLRRLLNTRQADDAGESNDE